MEIDIRVENSPVIPVPFVQWNAVVEAENPTRPATRGHYRSLKSAGRVSAGIRVHLRGDTGAHGSETYHSVLVVLAFKADQDGDSETAAHLRESSRKIEEEFGGLLANYLMSHPFTQLPQADFYRALLTSMSRELQTTAWQSHVLAHGVVSGVEERWARFTGETSLGDPSSFEFRRELLDSWHLGQGDSVFVFQRYLNSAILTELLPGVNARAHDDSIAEFEASLWPRRDNRERERLLQLARQGQIPTRTVRLTA